MLKFAKWLPLWIILCSGGSGCTGGETREAEEIAPGLQYIRIIQRAVPNTIHILELDWPSTRWTVKAVKAGDHIYDTEPLTKVAASIPGTIAAINGDFFSQEGSPSGALVSDGVWIKNGAEIWSSVGFTQSGRVYFEAIRPSAHFKATGERVTSVQGVNRPRLDNEIILYNDYYGRSTATNNFGTEVRLSVRKIPEAWDRPIEAIVREVDSAQGDHPLDDSTWILSGHGAANMQRLRRMRPGMVVRIDMESGLPHRDLRQLIGAYPVLVREKKSILDGALLNKEFARNANARTAIGYSEARKKLILVCVDGKQANYSVGMNLTELADLMIALGCESASNLDGGGSTAMLIRDRLVNRPSDSGLERPISDALVIVSADN